MKRLRKFLYKQTAVTNPEKNNIISKDHTRATMAKAGGTRYTYSRKNSFEINRVRKIKSGEGSSVLIGCCRGANLETCLSHVAGDADAARTRGRIPRATRSEIMNTEIVVEG